VGNYLGSQAGGVIGSAVSQILGRGAYTVRKNSLMTSSTEPPKISSTSLSDGVLVDSREFILDVISSGSTAWSIQTSVNLNAGLPQVFTYLSQLGVAFEEVEYLHLLAVYEPSSGELSTTQGLGKVMFATQYDLQDLQFTSQVEMLDYEYSTVARPCDPAIHPIECDPRNNPLSRFYLRSGLIMGTTSTYDPRYNAYDLGRLVIATTGVPAAAGVVLGSLYFKYAVKFFKPKLYGGLVAYNLLHDYYPGTGLGISGSSGVITSYTLPVGPSSNSTLGTVLSQQGGPNGGLLTITFPPSLQIGTFEVIALVSNGVATGISTLNIANCTFVNCQLDDTLQTFVSAVAGSVSTASSCARIRITGPNASMTTLQSASPNSTNSFLSCTGSFGYFFQLEIFQVYSGSM
jgi:hypothetical protein